MKKLLNSLKTLLCLTLCLIIVASATGVYEVNTSGDIDPNPQIILGDDGPGSGKEDPSWTPSTRCK